MDLIEIAETLNEKSKEHRIGGIQTIRYKIGRQEKKAIQQLFYIRPDTLNYWGNWILLLGGVKEFLFCLHLDKENNLWYGLSLPLKNKGMFVHNDRKKLIGLVEKINTLLFNCPAFFSEYSMWRENDNGIGNITDVQEISAESLDGASSLFIGKSMEINNIDFETILDTFDKMLDIYIKINTGNLEADYASLSNYEPPPKPKTIREWSDELIQNSRDALETLTFGVDPIRRVVCLKKNDGSYGVISFENATNHVYHVIDDDGNAETFSTVDELIEAGWVLD